MFCYTHLCRVGKEYSVIFETSDSVSVCLFMNIFALNYDGKLFRVL